MDSKAIRIVDRADWVVSKVVVIIFIVFFACSVYAVYDSIRIEHDSRSGDQVAADLNGLSVSERLNRMHADNDEVKAWLDIKDSGINHPVMQATNNSYYLSHDYKRDYTISGSIFMDYRNGPNSDYYIYYGHNVNDETMLGRVNKYADIDFFMAHRSGELTISSNEKHNLTVIAYAVTPAANRSIYDLDILERDHNSVIIEAVKAAADNINPDSVPTKKLILLSTCTRNTGERAVLLLGYDD